MSRRPRLGRDDAVRLLGAGASVDVFDLARARRRPPTAPRTAVGTGGPDATRVLGLDLALGTTGWCLLVGGRPAAHGSFDLPDYQRKGESLAAFLGRRAEELGRQVALLLAIHRPEVVGYEYPDTWRRSWSGGTKGREFLSVQGLSRAEGFLIALWPSIGGGVPLVPISTSLAKRTAPGRVDASKDQVAYALRTYFGWDVARWTPDETDAAAVALAARETIG